MNKKQLACLFGVGVGGILTPAYEEFWQFIIWVITVLIITGVLIYTLRDKPKDKKKEDGQM